MLRYWVLLPAALLATPLLALLWALSQPQWDVWQHLADTVLRDYVTHSFLLALFVGIGCAVLGTVLAWCCHFFHFPGRPVFEWLLLLPLAMPAYIIAYCYTGLLDFAGPLQTLLRTEFGWTYGSYWFPEVRSLTGAVVMLILVLYPYVFIVARNAFRDQSPSMLAASQSAGLSVRQHFIRVAVPLARPAIVTGSALAMMEALADYGTVEYFGVSTFTTGIFRTWFGMGNPIAAQQLAALLTLVVFSLVLLEQFSRRKIRYFHLGQSSGQHQRVRPSRGLGITISLFCATTLLMSFFIPVVMLLRWIWMSGSDAWDPRFVTWVSNSFGLAVLAAIIVTALALMFSYAARRAGDWRMQLPLQVVKLGYAVPGTVIAVAILLPLSTLDKWLNAWSVSTFDVRLGLIFSGTLAALILAYAVRFMTVAMHQIENGLARIKPSMEQAAFSLGRGSVGVLRDVHLPLLHSGMFAALLLVFVDVLKELPATLILRPFNFDTLAVKTYELASDERLSAAALPALTILLTGLVPVILLAKAMRKGDAD